MLAVLRGDNWLRERSLEEPAFLHPFQFKRRVDTFEIWQKLLKNITLAHLEQRVIHWSIVAEIDEVPSAIFCGWTKVGMLYKTGKWIPRITRIDPVAIGKLAIKGEYKALCAIGLTPIIACAIIVGQCGYETRIRTWPQRAARTPYCRDACPSIDAARALRFSPHTV